VKRPELVNATQEQLDELLRLAKTKTAFSAEHYELLERVLGTFVFVMLSLQSAKTSIKRFRQMLFGARTAEQIQRAQGPRRERHRRPAGGRTRAGRRPGAG
jgi:hypothetical protein